MNKNFFTILILIFLFGNTVFAVDNKKVLRIGDERAKVTVKVFSSLTCPHCAHFHEKIYYKLKEEYIDTGKVKFEHHGFPLDLAALNAEKILRCVDGKEKRFRLLNEIYKQQDKWAVGSDIKKINKSLKKIGLNFNLDNVKIDKCLKNDITQDQILNERIDAQKKYKISSTPTIFINEKKYKGNHEYKNFKKILNKNL